VVEGLLQLLRGDALFFDEKFAYTDRHQVSTTRYTKLTIYVNSDLKCQP
jgi:hypothetical protein